MEANFTIVKNSVNIAPDVKVLKANEYTQFIKASELLAKAGEQADRIIEDAQEVYEKEKQRGFTDGKLEGKMVMSEQMMDNVSKTIAYFESVEDKVTSVVMTSLKKIIGAMNENKVILRIIRNHLSVVRNQKEVTVRVAPEQFEVVKTHIDKLISGYPGIGFLDVVADSRLSATDCILESEIGTVEAGIDVQLEAIRRSLEKCFKKSERAE